jgi:predicted DNA-binding transcriptional regulator YafY
MKEHAKLDRLIHILLTLAGVRNISVDELCERFDISRRTVHRYFSTFREAGFVVECIDGRYRIPKIGNPFKELSDLLHFSEEEAYVLTQAIHSIDDTNILKSNLIKKLYSIYDFKRVADSIVKPENSLTIHALIEAITDKKQVLLRRYRSAHGNIVRDRMVEPFDFTTNYICLWAYEPESGQCKLFKTARIGSVEIMVNNFLYEDRHIKLPEDVFRISSSHKTKVKLCMSLRAYNLLIEEYPLAQKFTIPLADNLWQFETEVCSFEGVGRFVMGLTDEVKSIEPEQFRSYLRERIKKMTV